MVLESQLYPQGGYAYTHQENHGYAQEEEYCSEDAYYHGGSSVQQVKPYFNIATPQPSKHHEVGYQGYGQNNNGWYGNHQKHEDSMGKHQTHGLYGKPHGYDQHGNHQKHDDSMGKYHTDGFYGKPHAYGHHENHQKHDDSMGKYHTDSLFGKSHGYGHDDTHGYPRYQNGTNNSGMSFSYYAEGRDHCPPSSQYPNQQNWPKVPQWIHKSLDD